MVNKFYKSNIEKVYVDGKWRLVYQKHKSKKLYIKRKGEYVYLSKKMRGGLIDGDGDVDGADGDKYIKIDIEQDVVDDFLVAQIDDNLRVTKHLYISKNEKEDIKIIIEYNTYKYSRDLNYKFKHVNDNILMVLYDDGNKALYTENGRINVYMFAIKNKNDGNKYFLAVFKKDDIRIVGRRTLNNFTLEVFNTIKEQYHVPTDEEHKTEHKTPPDVKKTEAKHETTHHTTSKAESKTKINMTRTNNILQSKKTRELSEQKLAEQTKWYTVDPESQPEPDDAPTLCGINGLGNGCYMNTALQMFIHMPEFNKAMIKLSKHENASVLVKAYVDFFKAYERNKIVDKEIMRRLFTELNKMITEKFGEGKQEDMLDFFSKFIDVVDNGTQKIIDGKPLEILTDDGDIKKLFRLKLNTNTPFLNENIDGLVYDCEDKVETQITYELLRIIDIKISDINDINYIITNDNYNQELLENDERKKCENAISKNEQGDIIKTLKNIPFLSARILTYTIDAPIFIIQLKIFDNEKNKKFAIFKIPNKIVKDDKTYNLKGMSMHYGKNIDRGHYVYFSKEKNKWYEYSDQNYTECTINTWVGIEQGGYNLSIDDNGVNEFTTNASTPCPYVLYYERQD